MRAVMATEARVLPGRVPERVDIATLRAKLCLKPGGLSSRRALSRCKAMRREKERQRARKPQQRSTLSRSPSVQNSESTRAASAWTSAHSWGPTCTLAVVRRLVAASASIFISSQERMGVQSSTASGEPQM